MGENEKPIHALERALLKMRVDEAREVLVSLGGGAEHAHRVAEVVTAALERIGALWETGDLALSQVYMAGRIVEGLVDELIPPGDPGRIRQPKLAIVTLADHHLLGKRIVSSTLRAAGYELHDLGLGLSPDEVVRDSLDLGVEVLLVSTLMFSSALLVGDVVQDLRAQGATTKVIVGGAPFRFDPELWRKVGADATGLSGTDALRLLEAQEGGWS